jgi:hypothetical protein
VTESPVLCPVLNKYKRDRVVRSVKRISSGA